jgi:alpha-N-arabinofuranosidase
MRDALVAGLSLNIFNKHCDRVKMANIAQLINVLQAVILTDGPKMIKTPTYHIFHMYKYHQDAELLDSYIDGTKTIGEEKQYMVPNLQESVSIDKEGIITITINNLSTTDSEPLDIAFTELKPTQVTSSIVTNKMDAHNTFEAPDTVKEETFKDYTITDNGISFTLPACSVIQFRVK